MPHNNENKRHTAESMMCTFLYCILKSFQAYMRTVRAISSLNFNKYSSSISYGHGCCFGRQAFEDKLSHFLFPPIPLHPRPPAVTAALSLGVGSDGKTWQKNTLLLHQSGHIVTPCCLHSGFGHTVHLENFTDPTSSRCSYFQWMHQKENMRQMDINGSCTKPALVRNPE